MPRNAKAMLIAAPRSGAGKTTVTLALLAAFRAKGLRVRAAKSGPDYIDPAFHQVATGAPCLNLDCWAMGPALLESVLHEAAADADLLIVESAMGLFDGAPGADAAAKGQGAAAELAIRFRLPVLLVLDVAGQAQSAAAIALGFASFDPGVCIASIILNRVGSPRHRAMVERAIATLGIPVVGAIPRDESVHLPERHLGLVQALEHDDLQARLDHLAGLAFRHCDLAHIEQLAWPLAGTAEPAVALPPPGQRIALARDAAFTFLYPHLLSGWRRAGAEIVPFSPLADEAPPHHCDACWLPGGYPELHAGALAAGSNFRQALAHFAATRPVHGECGGYMVLGAGLVDAGGTRHAMTGLLDHATSFAARRLHLGYRTARLLQDCPLGVAGASLHGHEFHYASLIEPGSDAPLAELFDAEGEALGPAGGCRGHVTGSFFHVIAAGQESAAAQAPQSRLAELA
jgi:cobyrinic acid a,c-diamide synthase